MALLAPAGTPRDIINKVGADVNRVLKSSEMQERFVSLGQEVIAGPPEQVTEYALRDGARYAAIIREINLAPE